MDEKEPTRELVVVDVRHYKKVKKALHESEGRYRQLFENVPIGIYRTTPDGRIIDANPALVKMAGFGSFAEMAQLNLNQEYSKSGHKRADFIQSLERDGEVKGLESLWRTRDGNEIHVRENARLVRDEKGEVFFEGTVEDITQSKLAEAAKKIRNQQLGILNRIISSGNLAESMVEMLEKILDCVIELLAFDTAGIYMVDPEARKVNLIAKRGAPSQFFLTEKYMAIDRMPFSQVLLHGRPVFVDHLRDSLPDLAKQWNWQMACSVPLVSKGRVVGAMNVASGRRSVFSPEEKSFLELVGKEAGTLISKLQTEMALRESEKYYRTLIDTSPDIIVVMDLNAKLITVNQQFLKVGGYFYDDVIGGSTFDFVTGLELDILKKKTSAFIKKKRVSGSEYLFKKKDGQSVPLEVTASIFNDGQGRPKGIIAIGRDISERKRGEEQLRFLGSITENISDAITVTDTHFNITYINKVGETLFGYKLDEVKGKTPEFFNADPMAEKIQQNLYKIVSSGRVAEQAKRRFNFLLRVQGDAIKRQ
jgi:PAS domain S-box-containing protein